MRLDLSKPVVNLEGAKINDDAGKVITIGRILANVLITTRPSLGTFDAMKAYIMAQRFYEGTGGDIDEADFKMITELLKQSDNTTLVTGQVLLHMEDVRARKNDKVEEVKKKKKK